jgi:hypothetical protein
VSPQRLREGEIGCGHRTSGVAMRVMEVMRGSVSKAILKSGEENFLRVCLHNIHHLVW